MLAPPSTGNTTPVTNFAAGELKYTAVHPISSGLPNEFMGVLDKIFCFRSISPLKAFSTRSALGLLK